MMKNLVVAAHRNKGKFKLDGILHTHLGDYEIIQIWEGCGRIVVGEMVLPMRSGALYLIDASNLHFVMPDYYDRYERNAIRIHGELLSDMSAFLYGKELVRTGSALYIPLTPEEAIKADELFRSITERQRREDAESALLTLSDISCLLSFFMRAPQKPESVHTDGVTERLIFYVKENYKSRIDLSDLSRELGISKYYLCRIFKQSTGMRIFDYVHSYRLAEAKKLLATTELSATEIAYAVGFDTYSYFSAFFKQNVGASPREFRKQIRRSV